MKPGKLAGDRLRGLCKPSYISYNELGYTLVINSPKSQWLNKKLFLTHTICLTQNKRLCSRKARRNPDYKAGPSVVAPYRAHGLPRFCASGRGRQSELYISKCLNSEATLVTPTQSPLAWTGHVALPVFKSAEKYRGIQRTVDKYCFCHIIKVWAWPRSQQKLLKNFKWGSEWFHKIWVSSGWLWLQWEERFKEGGRRKQSRKSG